MSKLIQTAIRMSHQKASRLGLGAALVAVIAWSNPVLATDEANLNEAEGVVQEVSVSESKVLITGIRYEVEPHASVEVRGSVSSIAALRSGMKVRFVYEEIEAFDAEIEAREVASVIYELEQLPDNHVVEEF